MIEPVALSSPRRRKRRDRPEDVTLRIRVARFADSGRLTYAVMLIAISYLLVVAAATQSAIKWYGDVALNDSDAAVLYQMGQPSERLGSAVNGTWRYRKQTTVTTVTFSNGRVSRIACLARRLGDAACPEMLGLNNLSSETDMLVALGHPDRSRYYGEMRVVAYDGLGLSFGLLRRQIYTIEVSKDRADLVDVIARFLRVMVP